MDQRNSDQSRKKNESAGGQGPFPTMKQEPQPTGRHGSRGPSPSMLAHNQQQQQDMHQQSNAAAAASLQGLSSGTAQSSHQAAQIQALQGLLSGLQSQQHQQPPLLASSLQQLLQQQQQQQQLQQIQSLQQLLSSGAGGHGSPLTAPIITSQTDSSLQGGTAASAVHQLIPMLLQNRGSASVAASLPALSAIFGSTSSSNTNLPGAVNSSALLQLLQQQQQQQQQQPSRHTSAGPARKNSTGTSSSDDDGEDKKPKALPFNVAAAYRQQQQLLELSSSESSSFSDPLLPHLQQRQQQSSPESDERHFLFPCRARAVPPDHNSKTAVLRIPPNVKHGQGLVCSHEGCQRKGIKFLYCSVCKTPVAKANFGNRHKHINQTTGTPASAAAALATAAGKKATPAAAAASSGGVEGVRKRGRPPKVISIKQKQQQQEQRHGQAKRPKTSSPESERNAPETNAPNAGASLLSSLTSSGAAQPRPQNSEERQRTANPTQSSQLLAPPASINWDSLMAGQFQRLSPNERLELWRYMLENRPSPTSSPSGQSGATTSAVAAHSSSGAVRDPRALREWLDRILWMSNPENWSQQDRVHETAEAPAASEEGEGNVAASAAEMIYEVLEEDGEAGMVEEKQGDSKGRSSPREERKEENTEPRQN